jgi:hypothetical protein
MSATENNSGKEAEAGMIFLRCKEVSEASCAEAE